MKLFKTLTGALVATATLGLISAPAAYADKGRGDNHGRGNYSGGHQGGGDYRGGHDNRGGHQGRGDYYKGDHRGDNRHHGNDYRGHNSKNYYKYRDYRPPAPRHVYRPAPPPHAYRHHAPPRYNYVQYSRAYGPYYHQGYHPRHAIGGWYRPHPRTVYITDYYSYGLYPPPPGHYWVRDYDSGDAVLASVATGAIIGLVIGALATN